MYLSQVLILLYCFDFHTWLDLKALFEWALVWRLGGEVFHARYYQAFDKGKPIWAVLGSWLGSSVIFESVREMAVCLVGSREVVTRDFV